MLSVLPGRTVLVEKRRTSIGRLWQRLDWTALALLFSAGAFLNAAAMTERAGGFLRRAEAASALGRLSGVAALYGGGLCLVATALAICASLTPGTSLKETAGRYVWTLVPLGTAMWTGHLLFHFLLAGNIVAVVERFAQDHGVGLPREVTSISTGGFALRPDGVFSLQLLLLGVGFLVSSALLWKQAATNFADEQRGWGQTLRVWTPWELVAMGLYAAGVWVFLQPMEMRGMA
jgi:hypothetical protein